MMPHATVIPGFSAALARLQEAAYRADIALDAYARSIVIAVVGLPLDAITIRTLRGAELALSDDPRRRRHGQRLLREERARHLSALACR